MLLKWVLVAVVVGVAWRAADAAGAAGAGEAVNGTFRDLGVQITSMTLQGTAFTTDPSGRDLVCAVIRGEPAKLIVFDLKSGQLLHRLALPGAKGAWNAATASDGSVYAGTDDNGHLYRWVPGEGAIHDLGQVAPDQTFAWDVTAGADGEVFVSTYPGCLVLRYHPKDGFSDVGRGAVVAGENYARGIAYDPASRKLYVGVATHAHLIELDPKTGEKKDILPEEFRDQTFCYSCDVAGGKLFVQITPANVCMVMDLATKKVDAVLPDNTGQQVVSPKSPPGDVVYYKRAGKVYSYDLKTAHTEPVKLGGTLDLTTASWVGDDLVALTRRGRLVRFNPATGKDAGLQLKPPPEATPIQSICCGPDGRIYTGGYLVGGLGTYDPKTGKHEQYNPVSQSEAQGVLGSSLYLGVYPQARLYAYDTTKPWDGGKTNPKQLDVLERVNQSRPMAVLGVPERNKVFFGTVPEYGQLGGVLAVYDPTTAKVDVHRNVVEDQSVVALAWSNGTVVGGTSRSGGLGIDPKAKEAKLFGWDPEKNEKIFEVTPVPGAWAITGLCTGPDDNIWGFADQTLFVFDVKNRKTVYTAQTFPADEATQHARWRNGELAMHPSGQFYGTLSGRLFRLDPKSKQLTVLREKNAILLAVDPAGRVYFRDRTNLWQYSPEGK